MFYNLIIINKEKEMKLKLLTVVFVGLLSASCTMENVQTETAEAKQTVESYIVQAQDYISNLF